jgi:hypothetical protein
MVVHDFHPMRTIAPPDETNAPLVIYPYAVLSFAITLQGFQAIPWGNLQTCQFGCRV